MKQRANPVRATRWKGLLLAKRKKIEKLYRILKSER
ncbi:hypothetical protein NITGR_150019 [Nitrospina gracilis 3/211]|uniref:Uncharacterized protein n=1 Tax=Nitrospina gracilis (strain 3/211) TaxID=1266370 RepID=M1YVN7_NITG3|nr:hypothetical protein NITGR_150019 [Nitrospina gracilis 3/211]